MTTASLLPAARNKRHGYSSYQIALHWTVVGLVAFQWFLGQQMTATVDALEAATAGGPPVTNLGAAYVHIAFGITILIVMLARLAAKLRRPVQVAPDSDHPWARTLGTINHWAFYAVLIGLPVLGAIGWFGGSELAKNVHAFVANVLPWLIALHVLGALTHQFVFRDRLINRIVRDGPGT